MTSYPLPIHFPHLPSAENLAILGNSSFNLITSFPPLHILVMEDPSLKFPAASLTLPTVWSRPTCPSGKGAAAPCKTPPEVTTAAPSQQHPLYCSYSSSHHCSASHFCYSFQLTRCYSSATQSLFHYSPQLIHYYLYSTATHSSCSRSCCCLRYSLQPQLSRDLIPVIGSPIASVSGRLLLRADAALIDSRTPSSSAFPSRSKSFSPSPLTPQLETLQLEMLTESVVASRCDFNSPPSSSTPSSTSSDKLSPTSASFLLYTVSPRDYHSNRSTPTTHLTHATRPSQFFQTPAQSSSIQIASFAQPSSASCEISIRPEQPSPIPSPNQNSLPSRGEVHPMLYPSQPTTKTLTHQKRLTSKYPFFKKHNTKPHSLPLSSTTHIYPSFIHSTQVSRHYHSHYHSKICYAAIPTSLSPVAPNLSHNL